MNGLYDTIAIALNELGDRTDMSLGSKSAGEESSPMEKSIKIEDWRKRLLERLEREAGVHKWMLLVILLACITLFGVGLFLLLYNRDAPGSYRLIFGGGALAGMLAVLNVARRTLMDKAYYDIALPALTALPPDQVVVVLKNLKNTREAKQ